MKRDTGLRILLASVFLFSVQTACLLLQSRFFAILLLCLACFALHVATRWINPASSLVISLVIPMIGLVQGLYPSFFYAMAASMANGIMISIAILFQKRSMLVGILLSSFFRFLYCWVMVFRIMPMAQSLDPGDYSMRFLFSWPQILCPVLGGLLALPVLFLLQLRQQASESSPPGR